MAPIPVSDCTLIIPAYNEERRISRLLDIISTFRGEIIFVCDGTDRTAEIITAFSHSHPNLPIQCLKFHERLGKGGGVLAGLNAAVTPYIGFMDADGSTSPTEMERLFGYLASSDGVIGSRWLSESVVPVRQGIWRRIQSRVFNILTRALFGLTYQDTQCGAKVFRKMALDEVLPRMRSRGFEFDVELLWRMHSMGFYVVEVPTVWENTGDSRVKISDVRGMVFNLVILRISSLWEKNE
jgi:dolichol-phosphate mannosyltransferase